MAEQNESTEESPGTRVRKAVNKARLVVVTGKGGVGKTTVTAALARLAAADGRRVLACEVGTEPGVPSRLAEALTGTARPSPGEPEALEKNIDLVLLTPEAGHRAFLREVLPFAFLAERALNAEPLRRFLSAAPALMELGVLYRGLQLMKQTRSGGGHRWDVLVLDAPATGHTVAFASLPEVALRIFPSGPIGRALREGLEVLTDPERTVSVVTTLPEALPVAEALELVKGLEKHKVRVEGIIANLVPADPFSEGEHAAVQDWLSTLHASGGHAPEEVLGHHSMGRLSRARSAIDTLRAEAGRMMLTVRETREKSGALVDWVAGELRGA